MVGYNCVVSSRAGSAGSASTGGRGLALNSGGIYLIVGDLGCPSAITRRDVNSRTVCCYAVQRILDVPYWSSLRR